MYNELTGLGQAASAGPRMPFRTGHEGATVRMDPSGAVTVLAGVTSQGQGLETTIAQVVASALGLSLDAVAVRLGDTDAVPFGLGAFASRQAVIGGGAAMRAARAVRDKAMRRYVCVEDTGRVINPLVVEGQVQGAIAQGIGGALLEHLRYDADGQLLTGTLMDYALPTASAIPPVTIGHIEDPAENLLGVRGVGEGGTLGPAAALANAVADALAAHGAEPDELPLTPARLWAACAPSPRSLPD